jgi:1,4-dihydroxy-2-naphthoyl-CoA synthase
MDEAVATAKRIVAGSPFAHRSNKLQLLRLMRDWSPVSRAERLEFYDFAETEDYRLGYEAFMQKRSPRFQGK